MRNVRRVIALTGLFGMCAWGQAAGPNDEKPYPVFGDVKAAMLMRATPAKVPADAADMPRVTALVVVVASDGMPTSATVANQTASPLDDAAIAAVMQSEFLAGSLRGKPVATQLMVWVPFVGKDQPAIPVAGTAKTVKNLKFPIPINTPAAEYSEEARRKGLNALVVLEMLVTEQGEPLQVHVLVPAGSGLDEQAVKAAQKYTFNPATLDGVPVPWLLTLEVNFRISGGLHPFVGPH
jgi:TonB family protein